MYVLASKNGTTWDTVRVDHGVNVNSSSNTHFGLPAGGAYKEIISLSKYIGGAASPKVRIHWGGSSHYFWQIDDIKIQEGEYNQIAMRNTYARNYTDTTFGVYEDYYTKIPMTQANKITMGFAGKYENIGSRAQLNTRLNLEINGPGGFKATSKSTPKNLAIQELDSNSITVTTSQFSLTNGMGMYEADLFCTSDSVLTRTVLDTMGYSIEVSDSVYARDNDNGRQGSVVYYDPTVVQQYEVGAYYELAELDTVSSVSFYMDDANVRRTNNAGLIQCHIYRTIGLCAGGVQQIQNAPLFSSKKVKITDLKIPAAGGWISMAVDRNTAGLLDTLNPGGLVVAYVADQFFGTDTIFVSLEGRDGHPSHHFIRQEQGGTWGNWGYSRNKTYIRLNVKPGFCPALNGNATATATTACGSVDGTVTAVDPTTGAAPYKYAWGITGTPTSKTVSNLASGSYQVTITDANGCADVFSANVSDAGGPAISGESTKNVVCAGKGEGEIKFSLTAGLAGPGYTFFWQNTNGDTLTGDSTLSGIEAGSYSVVVTDNGTPPCKQTKSYTITGATSPLSVPTENVIDVTCNGDKDGSVVISTAGGTGTVSVAWTGTGTGSGSTITGLPGGTVYGTLTDANNCTLLDTFVVAEPAPLVLSTGSVTENPGKGTITIIPSTTGGNTGGYSHTWKNSAGQTCTANSSTGEISIGHGAGPNQETKGTYTVTVQDVKGCSGSLPYNADQTVLGVEAFGSNYKMNIFPNPNNGTFKISMVNADNANYTIDVKNMLGQTVYSSNVDINGNYSTTVELNDNGVYFLSISNGDKTESYKVVVE